MTGQSENYLPLLQALLILQLTCTCLPELCRWPEVGGWKRRKTRLTMELIIYATFLVLSLIAYAARQVANKGEEKKVSVSNINFKRYLIPSGNKLSSFFPAFKRVFSSYTSSPCSVTGCKGLMFINSTPSTASRSRRSRSSMWPASHLAWFSGPAPGPSLISGEGGRWWGGFLFEKNKWTCFYCFHFQAISFSVIYTFCCLTKMSPNFWWLMIGRIFGGDIPDWWFKFADVFWWLGSWKYQGDRNRIHLSRLNIFIFFLSALWVTSN